MTPCPICHGLRISDDDRHGEMCVRCYVRVVLRTPARMAEWYRRRWLEETK